MFMAVIFITKYIWYIPEMKTTFYLYPAGVFVSGVSSATTWMELVK